MITSLANSSPAQRVIWLSIIRPIKLLFLSPVVLSLCLYTTFVYGIYYIFLTTMERTFKDIYGFTEGTVGLAYIGLGIGTGFGIIACGHGSDLIVKRLSVYQIDMDQNQNIVYHL